MMMDVDGGCCARVTEAARINVRVLPYGSGVSASNGRRKGLWTPAVLRLLRRRELGVKAGISKAGAIARKELEEWADGLCARSHCLDYVKFPPGSGVRSTISVSFSPSGKYFASSHGDHTVKVFLADHSAWDRNAEIPGLIHVLNGHPRTPWSVRFHPHSDRLIASGCLAGNLMIWKMLDNPARVECIARCNLNTSAIISLAFHPTAEVIVAAAGTEVFVWPYLSGPPRSLELHVPQSSLRSVNFFNKGAGIIIGQTKPPRMAHVEGPGVMLNVYEVVMEGHRDLLLRKRGCITSSCMIYNDKSA
eukprot:g322.t1